MKIADHRATKCHCFNCCQAERSTHELVYENVDLLHGFKDFTIRPSAELQQLNCMSLLLQRMDCGLQVLSNL